MKTTQFQGYGGLGLPVTVYLSIGVIVSARGDEAEIKTAYCEITRASGTHPIYGNITLNQQVLRKSVLSIETEMKSSSTV